jgi:hypothetical protein
MERAFRLIVSELKLERKCSEMRAKQVKTHSLANPWQIFWQRFPDKGWRPAARRALLAA